VFDPGGRRDIASFCWHYDSFLNQQISNLLGLMTQIILKKHPYF